MSGISEPEAMTAIAAVASRCTGEMGLAARHLDSSETLSWRADEQFRTVPDAAAAAVASHQIVGKQGTDPPRRPRPRP